MNRHRDLMQRNVGGKLLRVGCQLPWTVTGFRIAAVIIRAEPSSCDLSELVVPEAVNKYLSTLTTIYGISVNSNCFWIVVNFHNALYRRQLIILLPPSTHYSSTAVNSFFIPLRPSTHSVVLCRCQLIQCSFYRPQLCSTRFAIAVNSYRSSITVNKSPHFSLSP